MSEIDAEKLLRAVDYYSHEASRIIDPDNAERAKVLIAAARAHLATLPRFKEVEIEAFAVVDSDGEAVEIWLVEENARLDAEEMDGTVVRLTGTAKVKVKP